MTCSFSLYNADEYGYLGSFGKNRAQPKTRQIGVIFFHDEWDIAHKLTLLSDATWFPCEMTSEKRVQILLMRHYPELGSEASSVWNFCARFSDVISRGNQWWLTYQKNSFKLPKTERGFSSFFFLTVLIYNLSQASFRRHSLHNSINTVPQVKSKPICFSSLTKRDEKHIVLLFTCGTVYIYIYIYIYNMKWKMGVSILAVAVELEKECTIYIYSDFWARTGASFKMACSWKVEESIDEPITQNLHREITVRMQRDRHGA